jgi:N-glycosylase/DNA lyase
MFKWNEKNGDIIVSELTNFDPVHTFECGQCFRWRSLENGHWFGVANGLALDLEWDGSNLIFHSTTKDQFINIWRPYFDLDRDYDAVKEKLSENDPVMAEAIRFGHGIRLLKQDFSETAVSFLISQNNGIPRIRKIIESLSAAFGGIIENPVGKCYAFPALERIAALSLEDLKIIRAGYRDKYIQKASRQLYNKEIDMDTVLKGDKKCSREEVLKLFGVGEKVADCILLFSGTRYDIFPVDRWVKRVMAELYLGYEADYTELDTFAFEHFGDLAGFAQQYLFYYARAKKIGIR